MKSGSIDRKRFLQVAGLGLLAGCAGEGASRGGEQGEAGTAAGARRTLAPPLDRIGVQLYTVRSLMADDVAATLDAMAAIGYREVEFAGYFGHTTGEIRGWLDAAGLTAPAAHVGIPELTEPGLDASIEAALAIGHEWLVLPSIGPEMRTADGYREVAGILNAAGVRAAPAGLRIGYHNHGFEFETVEDDAAARTGYSILVEHLDPALVDLEIDFHWSTVAGADALALFAEYPERFPLCHVKDMTADGAMADVGAGVIDWAGLFARSDQAGLRHYFVEHDQPGDPLASVEASYRYLSGM
ncbi:MAG: sugar phosphate isomerase/epimerase [Gemmatimonadota bacterium]|nr:sugar phosphate isomerase/epimerase [Gemmatimonadota bacterium]MDE2863533.1 sugar phosphate isomerase/epimerase [Gemmatimonadota bacterium]MYB06134.1 sugar phosphate isomerase/epimerase [Gemmatimonadota bacterium]MYE16941.1 sugar phosphate isomerase/epimerase [Gemmatimonadota bacterium]MYG21099.1 sugar phosphate isomerase/epimerase [Gemmatimonadota bacterium]